MEQGGLVWWITFPFYITCMARWPVEVLEAADVVTGCGCVEFWVVCCRGCWWSILEVMMESDGMGVRYVFKWEERSSGDLKRVVQRRGSRQRSLPGCGCVGRPGWGGRNWFWWDDHHVWFLLFSLRKLVCIQDLTSVRQRCKAGCHQRRDGGHEVGRG